MVMKDETSKNVVRFKTRRLVISSDEPVAWTRDGENGGEHRMVEMTNLHQVLDIMTGPVPEGTAQEAAV